MTMWPGVPLPLPPIQARRSTYTLHESGLALLGTGLGVEVGPDARVGEIYLDLYALDIEDLAAVTDFANRYGVPSGVLLHYALAGHSWFAGLFSPEADHQLRRPLFEASERQRESDPTRPDWDLAEVTTLTSFSFAAQLLRDLTDAWRIVKGDLDASTHEWQLPYDVHGDTRGWFFAAQLLSSGLSPLLWVRPYLAPTLADDEPPPPEEAEAWTPPDPSLALPVRIESAPAPTPSAHIAQFCALELFNHIAGSEVYRRCENENCDKVFVRQYGRAEHGQSRRQGVMYCSHHCAQAAASRRYRRRKRSDE